MSELKVKLVHPTHHQCVVAATTDSVCVRCVLWFCKGDNSYEVDTHQGPSHGVPVTMTDGESFQQRGRGGQRYSPKGDPLVDTTPQ